MIQEFLAKFSEVMPNINFLRNNQKQEVFLPALNSELGGIKVHFDDEITVSIGEHFHCHFDPLTFERQSQIDITAVDAAATYISDLLSDRIVFWIAFDDHGSYQASGTFYLGQESSLPQKGYNNIRQHLWSHPIAAS